MYVHFRDQKYNVMSDQIFLCSNQNGALVGQMFFQEKKLFAALQPHHCLISSYTYLLRTKVPSNKIKAIVTNLSTSVHN